MRKLSPETQSLIRELYPKRRSWLGRLLSKAPDSVRLIEKIAFLNEPAAISHIAPLTFSLNYIAQIKLAEAIARMIQALSQKDYACLDQQMRGSYSHTHYSLNLRPEDITAFSHLSPWSWVLLVLSSMSGNGYVREKSCVQLREITSPEALPFLLLRANDWVSQVRVAAIEAIMPYLSPYFAAHLIDNLYLILRLDRCRSQEGVEIRRQTYEVLLDERSKDTLLSALSHPDRFVRRACYQLVLSASHYDMTEILNRGFSDFDVLVRLQCAKKFQKLPIDAVSFKLALGLLEDPFPPIRHGAILLLSKFDYSLAGKALYDSLCDRSAMIRVTCRNLIIKLEKDLPEDSFQRFYLEQLKSDNPSNVEGAIAGLGEVGDVRHALAVTDLLKHRSAKVRKAAIRTLFKLDPKNYTETFCRHLLFDTGSVAKEAVLALCMSKSYISSAMLLDLFTQAENENNKLLVLLAMNLSLGKWEKITSLLKVCSQSDGPVLVKCHAYLDMWMNDFNKGSTSCSIDKLLSARKALSEARERLDPRLSETLDFFLK